MKLKWLQRIMVLQIFAIVIEVSFKLFIVIFFTSLLNILKVIVISFTNTSAMVPYRFALFPPLIELLKLHRDSSTQTFLRFIFPNSSWLMLYYLELEEGYGDLTCNISKVVIILKISYRSVVIILQI